MKKRKRRNRFFIGILLVVSILVSLFMWVLKQNAEYEQKKAKDLSEQLVTIVKQYGNGGINQLFREKNDSNALETFQFITNNFHDSNNSIILDIVAMSYFGMGFSYKNRKQYNKAIETYEKAIAINPKYGGDTYTLEVNEKFIALNPGYYSMYTSLGKTYMSEGSFDKAIKMYEKAIKVNPRHFKAYYLKGQAYFLEKKYDKAINSYQKAIKINPKNSDTYYHLVEIQLFYGNFHEGLKMLLKAEEINFCMDRVFFYMGLLSEATNDLNASIDNYTHSLKINKKNRRAFRNLYHLQLITNQEINSTFEKAYV